ncbi:MAG: ABC transporter permease [Chloroflexi bacterium]|nr:ABC transporter permease [Chloroflexota bacterium]
MRLYFVLTIASLKMYFRNRQAIFWALFFPMLIMLIFGLLNFDQFSPPNVGFVDNATSQASTAFKNAIDNGGDPLLDLSVGDEADLLEELSAGDIDALIIIPERFGEDDGVSTVRAVFDSRKPSEQGITQTVINDVLDSIFLELALVPDEFRVESRFAVEPSFIDGQGEGFRGFLVPGVAAMAIMQAGIFGVVFTLIRFKTGGVLRRLQATPIGPSHFLIGQMTTRLIVTVLQTYVLIVAGILALGVSVGNGTIMNWVDVTILALFGGALFTVLGLAISGWAKTEDVAAPVANIVTLPMMFLSGVFFPVSVLPDWLANVSQFFPLTYLADGFREVTVNGASITTLGPELLGLGIWTAVAFAVATRVFRWE